MGKLKQVTIAIVAAVAAICGAFFALEHWGVVAPGPGGGESPVLGSSSVATPASEGNATDFRGKRPESGTRTGVVALKDEVLQSAFDQTASPDTVSAASGEQILVTTSVRTTAYTHTEADHIKYGKKTALGTNLRYTPEYHSVAADWSRFPLGTKFRMKGVDRLFVVDDYGKALVGSRTVDIYFPSKRQMNHWGVRNVDINVVEFGNFHESRKILAARANYPHCREMLASMTSDDWWKDFR